MFIQHGGAALGVLLEKGVLVFTPTTCERSEQSEPMITCRMKTECKGYGGSRNGKCHKDPSCSRYIFFVTKSNFVHHLHVVLDKDNVVEK